MHCRGLEPKTELAASRHPFRALSGWGACCLALLLVQGRAASQETLPSRFTPSTFAQTRIAAPLGIQPPAQAQISPAGSVQLEVMIGQVVLEGAFAEPARAAQELADSYAGRRVKAAQLYELAAAIERIYAIAGYVLVRTGIPPQEIKNGGTLRIAVLNGYLEEVDVSGVPDRARHFVAQRTNRLIGVRSLTLDEIERQLLLAGDFAGLKLKSTLAPGKAEGAARLILEGSHNPISVTAGTDNRLPESMGRWQANASGSINGAFGLGEQIYASVGSSRGTDQVISTDAPLQIFAIGAVFPIGTNGLTLGPEFSRSITVSHATHSAPATEGTFERVSIRLAYPIIKTRPHTLDVRLAGEHVTQVQTLSAFGIDQSNDDYWVLRFGADYSTSIRGISAIVSGNLSQGLDGRDERDIARSDVALSRYKSSSIFTKLSGTGSISWPVLEAFRASISGSVQTSFGDALMKPEQFALDGTQGLSAFNSSAFSVDSGAVVRAEVARPFSLSLAGRAIAFEPYAFASAGIGKLEYPTAVETPLVRAYSTGLGIRYAAPAEGLIPATKSSIEIAHGKSNVTAQDDVWRVAASFGILF